MDHSLYKKLRSAKEKSEKSESNASNLSLDQLLAQLKTLAPNLNFNLGGNRGFKPRRGRGFRGGRGRGGRGRPNNNNSNQHNAGNTNGDANQDSKVTETQPTLSKPKSEPTLNDSTPASKPKQRFTKFKKGKKQLPCLK